MTNVLQTVLCLFIQFFAPRHNAQIRFLKAQIAILRKRVPAKHIVPSPKEKAELLRLGSEFGHQVGPLLEVVTLPTYRRWICDARKGRKPGESGRPRLSQELRELVVRLGQESILWGYRRVVGELIQDQEFYTAPPGFMTKRVEEIAKVVRGSTGYIMSPTCTPFQFPCSEIYRRNYLEWLNVAERLLAVA